jgi:hypothetical protein
MATLAKEHPIPSHIAIRLALPALKKAIEEIQYIEEHDLRASELQALLPDLLAELNKATFYLSNFTNPSTAPPIFSNN